MLQPAYLCPSSETDETSLFFLGPDNVIRRTAESIIRHPLFDPIVLAAVLVSSITLTLDRPGLDPQSGLKRTLNSLDFAFVVRRGLSVTGT